MTVDELQKITASACCLGVFWAACKAWILPRLELICDTLSTQFQRWADELAAWLVIANVKVPHEPHDRP